MYITTKYDYGDLVTTVYPEGSVGMITAITIRPPNYITYEVSYANDSIPTNAVLMECEIEKTKVNSLGFKKGK